MASFNRCENAAEAQYCFLLVHGSQKTHECCSKNCHIKAQLRMCMFKGYLHLHAKCQILVRMHKEEADEGPGGCDLGLIETVIFSQ